MTPTLRQFLLSLFVVTLFILLAAIMSAHARNMLGPDAYYDRDLDVLLRPGGTGQQIYDPRKDAWYNYDMNLQEKRALQQFQLHQLPESTEQKILGQLWREQGAGGISQPDLQFAGRERRETEEYERNYRLRHGLEPLPDRTLIPAPGMKLDPYAKQGSRENVSCFDPRSGQLYICTQP